jgi:hypothetical protein
MQKYAILRDFKDFTGQIWPPEISVWQEKSHIKCHNFKSTQDNLMKSTDFCSIINVQ